MATEVMDLLLKIGVTEEVTSALEGMSRLFEKLHGQAESMRGAFTSWHSALERTGVLIGSTGVGIVGALALAISKAGALETTAPAPQHASYFPADVEA